MELKSSLAESKRYLAIIKSHNHLTDVQINSFKQEISGYLLKTRYLKNVWNGPTEEGNWFPYAWKSRAPSSAYLFQTFEEEEKIVSSYNTPELEIKEISDKLIFKTVFRKYKSRKDAGVKEVGKINKVFSEQGSIDDTLFKFDYWKGKIFDDGLARFYSENLGYFEFLRKYFKGNKELRNDFIKKRCFRKPKMKFSRVILSVETLDEKYVLKFTGTTNYHSPVTLIDRNDEMFK